METLKGAARNVYGCFEIRRLFRSLISTSKELTLECVWFIFWLSSFVVSSLHPVRSWINRVPNWLCFSFAYRLARGALLLLFSWCHCGTGHVTLVVLFTLLTDLVTFPWKKWCYMFECAYVVSSCLSLSCFSPSSTVVSFKVYHF